jgi:hypothetical protein
VIRLLRACEIQDRDIRFCLFGIVATVKIKHMFVNNINGLMPQCSNSKVDDLEQEGA